MNFIHITKQSFGFGAMWFFASAGFGDWGFSNLDVETS